MNVCKLIIRQIRLRRKIHKLISRMCDCMTEGDVYESAAFIGVAYKLIPEYKKEAFLDELQKVVENVHNV